MSIMHTYTLVILLLLLLSSYLELPNPISVNANKLTSSNGVFKVDLIRRHSPLSPYYNSSMTPQEYLRKYPLGSISRGHNIRLSTAYYNNKNHIKRVNLIPHEGEFLIKIALGTPKVEFLGTADTGSDLIWVPCSPCANCIPQESPSFKPTKSSTFHMIPCTSSACNYTNLDSGCFTNNNIIKHQSSPCVYQARYGDNTYTVGFLAKETITLPSSGHATPMRLSSSVFGCSLPPGQGIVGLGGTSPLSLISQLGPKINYKFSYCLNKEDSKVNSKLTFGADVTGPRVVSTPFTIKSDTVFYHLTLDGISVVGHEGRSVHVPSALDIIIDSGTTFTLLPASVYSSLRTALASAITLRPLASTQETLDLCYNSSSRHFNPPDVVFHFKGADVVLKAFNTFTAMGNPAGVKCLAMVAADSDAIFGNIAQINFHVGYDLRAKKVSFAPTDCTTYC